MGLEGDREITGEFDLAEGRRDRSDEEGDVSYAVRSAEEGRGE